MKGFTTHKSVLTVFAVLAVGCLLLSVLYGCGGSGSPTDRFAETSAPGGIPGKPDKPPDEPQPPADPAIAFVADRDLWVMNADATNRTRIVGEATVSSASWSPDGQWLVFDNVYAGYPISTLEGRGLYVVSRDGGAPRLLVPAPDPSTAFCPAWSPVPGDDRIAYVWLDDAWGETGYRGEICAIRPEGGQPERLYTFCEPFAALGGISWSPDATRLTVAILDESLPPGHSSSLAILDVQTGELEDVTRPAGFDWVSGARDVDWARGSDLIAFSGRKVGEEPALWILDLTDYPSVHSDKLIGEWHSSLSWSPDDQRIVFAKRLRSPSRTELWTVEVATGYQTCLAKGDKKRSGLHSPDWRRF